MVVSSIQYVKVLTLRSFYLTLKNNTLSEKFNQNNQIKFNSEMDAMGRQGPEDYIQLKKRSKAQIPCIPQF